MFAAAIPFKPRHPHCYVELSVGVIHPQAIDQKDNYVVPFAINPAYVHGSSHTYETVGEPTPAANGAVDYALAAVGQQMYEGLGGAVDYAPAIQQQRTYEGLSAIGDSRV